MTTLVTGARGSVARGVVTLLRAAGLPVRVASKDPSALEPVDGVEAVPLDLARPDTAAEALRDVTKVFLYADAAGIADLVKAMQAADVEHIVLLSSSAAAAPDPETNPLAKSHHAVEVAVAGSGIPFTVLRPGAFAANAQGWRYTLLAGETIELPYPQAQLASIHEADIADVAARILIDGSRLGETVEMTGPQSLSFAEQIEILADVVGRPIPFVEVSRDRSYEQLTRWMDPGYANALLDLWETAVDPEPVSNATEAITGKPARTFRQWLEEHRDDFAQQQR
ncbi:NAD(P)H-binding protein [Streptomyces sp. SID3343]|uniref:NAD(P)H-binding protein n=1 Tax=Streptomyces sp. SID3343 TaxID=2690260 RepID=UPI00136A4B74|nr:NAD(P)H-binding protein [Streptomyces sp. SID3343]MYW03512.1 NAD(P)H-binding protein [Streptomyces sp. SID3343]